MELKISEEALNYMLEHAEVDYPNECCGFFYGRDNGDTRSVTLARQVKNSKEGDQSERFEIDPEDYRSAEKFALDHDLDLLGVYHSHPDHPAEPSEHDREVAMPWFSYIIISVQKGSAAGTRSWQLNEKRQFEEESVETKESSEQQKT